MAIRGYQQILLLGGAFLLLIITAHTLYKRQIISLPLGYSTDDEVPKKDVYTALTEGYPEDPQVPTEGIDYNALPESYFDKPPGVEENTVYDPEFEPDFEPEYKPDLNPSHDLGYDPAHNPEADAVSFPEPTDEDVNEPDIAAIEEAIIDAADPVPTDVEDQYIAAISETHRVLYSRSTADRKYWKVNTREHDTYNANFIPHPNHNYSWFVVAQKTMHAGAWYLSELWCEAMFVNGELFCVKSPLTLTIAATPGDGCVGKHEALGGILGPHDARAFWGPEFPITVYGANSAFTCYGQYAADLRVLMDWELTMSEMVERGRFHLGIELQRPQPYSLLEKNWFLWWDNNGDMYAHYNMVPRTFAKIEYNGTAGPNLAPGSIKHDLQCMTRYMPHTVLSAEHDSVHQATNSLSITLCSRSDPTCVPNPTNTVIMAVFHHKITPGTHTTYEPYTILFKQDAPFSVFGISTKPMWIYGRGRAGEEGMFPKPKEETEMIYITSMSWKTHGQKYHGYVDDELMLGFGIEDSRSGGIDIAAGDLLEDIGYCGFT